MLGSRTRGSRMEGADESTEQFCHPYKTHPFKSYGLQQPIRVIMTLTSSLALMKVSP